MKYDFMEEARQMAAQCWCDKETSDRVMDSTLAEAVAKRIASLMWREAQELCNVQYYQGLLDEIAKHLGPSAYVADDGSVSESPIRAKLPELVAAISSNGKAPAV
jgi:hypothetical protein